MTFMVDPSENSGPPGAVIVEASIDLENILVIMSLISNVVLLLNAGLFCGVPPQPSF